MLRDRALISHIGLKATEISTIQNSLQLPELERDKFEFSRGDERRAPDIVFVNADEPESLEKWQLFSQFRKYSIPIMVSSGQADHSSSLTIKTPITSNEVVQALNAISITDENIKIDNKSCQESFSVLVVDDSFLVRKFMSHMLPKLFCGEITIEFAGTGEEAIDMGKNKSYDIAFLDIMLPGIDGYKVCKWLKSNQTCYIVMLTSKKNSADRARGIMAGCNDYLTKPPKLSELQVVVDGIRQKGRGQIQLEAGQTNKLQKLQ